jgi:hypothetical protein
MMATILYAIRATNLPHSDHSKIRLSSMGFSMHKSRLGEPLQNVIMGKITKA